MLILDEAAWIPDPIYESVLPMLSSTNGSLWLMSTPAGQRGFFWEEWMRGDQWFRVLAPATECPRIAPAFLEEMRTKRGDDHVRGAYLCEFLSADDRLFDRGDLDAVLASDVPAFRHGDYGLRSLDREFVIGVDLGKLTDYSALAVLERIPKSEGFDPYTREYRFRHRNVIRHLERIRLGTSYPRVVDRIQALAREITFIGRCTVVVDATGVGEAVIDSLDLDCELVGVTITGGETTISAGNRRWLVPKKEIVVGLQGMIVRRDLEIAADLPLAEEATSELLSIGRSLRAEGGKDDHDDLVLAIGLAAWRTRTRRTAGERGERLL